MAAALVPITGTYVAPDAKPHTGTIYVERRDAVRGDGSVWVGVTTARVVNGVIADLAVIAPSEGAYRYRFTERLIDVPEARYELDVHSFDAAVGFDLTARSPDAIQEARAW